MDVYCNLAGEEKKCPAGGAHVPSLFRCRRDEKKQPVRLYLSEILPGGCVERSLISSHIRTGYVLNDIA